MPTEYNVYQWVTASPDPNPVVPAELRPATPTGVKISLPAPGVLAGWWRWTELGGAPIHNELRILNYAQGSRGGEWDLVDTYSNPMTEAQYEAANPGATAQAIKYFNYTITADHHPGDLRLAIFPMQYQTRMGAYLDFQYKYENGGSVPLTNRMIYFTGKDRADHEIAQGNATGGSYLLPKAPHNMDTDYSRFYDVGIDLQTFTYQEVVPTTPPAPVAVDILPLQTVRPLVVRHESSSLNYT